MDREEHFEKLEQFIFDENQILTYKIVSRELKIHVNEAKQLLQEFLEEHKSDNLNSTYFLSGTAEKEPGSLLKVYVVSKRNLEKTRKSLAEITSCHVYSVSKALVEDELALYRADLPYNWKDEECGNYVIKHPNIEIKTPVLNKTNGVKKEVKPVIPNKKGASFFKNVVFNSVKKNEKTEPVESNDTKEAVKPVENGKSKTESPSTKSNSEGASFFKNVASNSVKTNEKTESAESCDSKETARTVESGESKTQSPVKKSNSESKSQKPNTLTSMWQKKEDKLKKGVTSKSDGHGKTIQGTKQMPKNNIISMFSKQAEKKADSSSKKPASSSEPFISKTTEESDKLKEKCSVKSDENPKESEKIKEKSSKSSTDKKKKANERETKASKHKKDTDSDDEFQPKKKKHRRICTFDDSDSESESEEVQDRVQRNFLSPEELMETEAPPKPATPMSDDEEPIPPTPPVVSSKGKKKVWKNIQKTYEDEDGFFVTKQEKVLVSEDDEDPLPESSKKKEVNKQNQFTYRKQASLTSFFKQK